ncbi:MAG: gamma-glutamyltransferase [Geminicoccaceae bacterium]
MRCWLQVTLTSVAALSGVLSLGVDARAETDPGKSAVGNTMMVAAANPLAAQAGFNVLEAGGSAADAAVAIQMVLGLVEPQSSGIGGGAFLVYWDAANKTLTTLDGREKAPAAADPDYFLSEDGEPLEFWDAVVGGRSVGVPGTVKLMETLHQTYGRQDWASLLAPAIELAENGFEVSPRLNESIAEARELDAFDMTEAYFFTEQGEPLPAGERLTNQAYADTLKGIAAEGSSAFYTGPVAQGIVDTVAAHGTLTGIMTLDDLAAYEVVEREPVCLPYRGFEVCGMGPPSSGALTVGQILGMLSHFDLPGIGMGTDAAHLLAEAGKLAFADRALYMADSDFVRMPVEGLLDPTYLTLRAQQIRLDEAMEAAEAGNPPWREAALYAPDRDMELGGTSHFVVRDPDGNAVSVTTTVESGFGSRLMTNGFILNNELTDFSRTPEENGRPVANRVEGGKRPRSSMAPTIVLGEDGEPHLLIGSPGGSRIIGYVAQATIAVLDWGMDPQSAVDLGHVINRNGGTDLEEGTAVAGYEEALVARGHEVEVRDLTSGLHAILIDGDRLLGGADPRREGVAIGD